MNSSSRSLLLDVMTTLSALSPTDAPDVARQRIREVSAPYPGARVDLVWEHERVNGAFHYDALVRLAPGEPAGTASLSFARDGGLPWIARGSQRWEDRVLLGVNATTLLLDEALACIDFIWGEAPVLRHLVDVCLIREELRREPVEVSPSEVQQAMDDYRRARGLHGAEATREYLARTGLTHERLEALVSDTAAVAKLRRRLVGDRSRAYFDAHRQEFEETLVLALECEDEAQISRVQQRLDAGTSLAQTAVLEHAARFEQGARTPSSLLRTLRRGDGGPESGPAFAAGPGQVCRVSLGGARVVFLEVVSRAPAAADRTTLDVIERRLFDEWLEGQRRAATIKWKWGPARATAAL